jgi:hypothetical protein
MECHALADGRYRRQNAPFTSTTVNRKVGWKRDLPICPGCDADAWKAVISSDGPQGNVLSSALDFEILAIGAGCR